MKLLLKVLLRSNLNFKAQTYLQLLSSPYVADGVVQVVLAIFHKLAIACKRSVLQKRNCGIFFFFFLIKDMAKWTNWWEMSVDTQANCYKWLKPSFFNLVGLLAHIIESGESWTISWRCSSGGWLQEHFMAGTDYRFWDSKPEIMFSLVFRRSDLLCDPFQHISCLFVPKTVQSWLKSNCTL